MSFYSNSVTAIPKVHGTSKIEKKKTISAMEYVTKYTEYLVRGNEQSYALQRLLDVKCPLKIFEDCLTEEAIRKHCFNKYELEYYVSLFTNKMSNLRQKEFNEAKERFEKRGELTEKELPLESPSLVQITQNTRLSSE